MQDVCNILAKPNKKDILEKLSRNVAFNSEYRPFGDGHSAEKIAERIKEYLYG